MAVAPEVTPVRVQVRALASSGAGVAELPDGRVAFIHGTVPGDEADVQVERRKPRWATARLLSVREPGPHRVDPPCPLFGKCGGCTLQHLAYPEQLQWKARFVADALTRIGGLGEVAVPSVVPSPGQWHYRNRLSFTLKRLRSGRVVAGFHALTRPGRVVDVTDECILAVEPVRTAWSSLRRCWGPGARHLPEGGRLRLTLRHEESGVLLLVEGGGGDWDGRALADACDAFTAIWHMPSGDESARFVAGNPDAATPRAFTQVNRHVGDALVDAVVGAAGDARRVVDAYCGSGVYGRPLAEAGVEVVGIESEADAAERAAQQAPPGFRVVRGSVEGTLADHLPTDLVILNPPRTGLHPDVPATLVAGMAERIIYVSCDPATLARDLERLSHAYRIDGLRCFDLFPQTAHVETVAVLRRKEGAA